MEQFVFRKGCTVPREQHQGNPHAWEPRTLSCPHKSELWPLALVLCCPCITNQASAWFFGELWACYLCQVFCGKHTGTGTAQTHLLCVGEGAEGPGETPRLSGFPLPPCLAHLPNSAQVKKMAEIEIKTSENRTRGKSVTKTCEIICTFSSWHPSTPSPSHPEAYSALHHTHVTLILWFTAL